MTQAFRQFQINWKNKLGQAEVRKHSTKSQAVRQRRGKIMYLARREGVRIFKCLSQQNTSQGRFIEKVCFLKAATYKVTQRGYLTPNHVERGMQNMSSGVFITRLLF